MGIPICSMADWRQGLKNTGYQRVTDSHFTRGTGSNKKVYDFVRIRGNDGLLSRCSTLLQHRVTLVKITTPKGETFSVRHPVTSDDEDMETSSQDERTTPIHEALLGLEFEVDQFEQGEACKYRFNGENNPELRLVNDEIYTYEISHAKGSEHSIYVVSENTQKDCCNLILRAQGVSSLVPLTERKKEGKRELNELRSHGELTQTVGAQLNKAKEFGTWAKVRHHARKVTGCAMAVFLTPVIALFTSGLWVTDRVIQLIPTGVTILHNTMNSTAEGTQVFDARGLPGATCGTDPTSGKQYCAFNEKRFSWNVLVTTGVLLMLFAKALREARKSRAERTLDAMTSKGISILQRQSEIGRVRRFVMSLPLIGACFKDRLYSKKEESMKKARSRAGQNLNGKNEALIQKQLGEAIESELDPTE